MNPKALHALGFASGLAITLTVGSPAEAFTYTFGSNSPTPIGSVTPEEDEAIFNMTVRKNRTASDGSTGVYVIREQIYLEGSFDVSGTGTVSNINLRLFTRRGDAEVTGTSGLPFPSDPFVDPADPNSPGTWTFVGYSEPLTSVTVNSPNRFTFFNPGTPSFGPNGTERREVVLEFDTANIFTNTAPTVAVRIIDGQGICTRYPLSQVGFIDCDGVDVNTGSLPAFGNFSPEDADTALPPVLGVTGNFERERWASSGVGTTNALVRQTPAGLSVLALLPLAPLARLRRRYAVLIQENRQD